MATLELVLLLLAAVLISAVLEQIIPKVSSPLIQIVLGLVISIFAAGNVTIDFDSNLFLVLFIAPLLYDEARNADKAALLLNLKPVLGLAIGLVIVTMVVLGFFINWIIPSIPLAVAFALAAALGPTDAVAVSSLPKDIDMGQRRRNLLKGEYLLNDASGIIAFQFALAAAASGSYAIGQAAIDFTIAFFGGIAIGAALGCAANFIVRYARNIGMESSTFHVMFDLFVPFIIYLSSEPFGASGIIAVVVGGLVRGVGSRAIGPTFSRLNIVSSSVWKVFSFALNGIVFVLLGTQLPKAMQSTWGSVIIGNEVLALYAISITLVLLLIRFIWMLPLEYVFHKKEGRSFFAKENFHSALLMTIAGPKGAVTLSIILTIPVLLNSSSFFPQRELIIFLACAVILITLLLSNFVLPAIAPKTITPEEEKQQQLDENEAIIEILRTVIEQLLANENKANRSATQSIVEQYSNRIDRIKNNETDEESGLTALRRATYNWEIQHVTNRINQKEIDPTIGYKYVSRLVRLEGAIDHHLLPAEIMYYFRSTRSMILSKLHAMRKKLHVANVYEIHEQVRQIQIESMSSAVAHLQETMSTSSYNNEDIGALIREYNKLISSLRSHSPAMSSFKANTSKLTEVKRKALAIENEEIQNMYDSGRISRSVARNLRDNVQLMRIDLEDDELSE